LIEKKLKRYKPLKYNKKELTPAHAVKLEYSNSENIKRYLSTKLWDSEELLIKRYFKLNGSVLDIGCGAGRTTIAMAKMGFNVTGIDLIPEMIKVSKKQAERHNVNVNFMIMDAIKLDFPSESFDGALFSYNGFENIHDKKNCDSMLEALLRILRPNGHFILTARSGLAFNKRSIAWMFMFFRHYLLRPIGLSNPNLKLGDMIVRGKYHHYHSPFKLRKMLQAKGFILEFFNSRSNIQKNKPSTFFTNFSTDNSLFYVAWKPKDNI